MLDPYGARRYPGSRSLMAALVALICAAQAATASTVSYTVAFDESVEAEWVRRLMDLSVSVTMQPEGAVSISQIRRRAEKDQDLFLKALRSEGLYGAVVAFRLDVTTEPVTVRFSVEPGPLYVLDETELDVSQVEPSLFHQLASAVQSSLPVGAPARAARIVATDEEILNLLNENGHPLARIEQRRVVVNHDTHRVQTHYMVDAGPKSRFGPVEFKGLESVRKESILPRIPWQEGDVFDSRLLTKLQTNLIQMDLFSIVRVAHGPSVDPQGRLPIQITVVEKKPRTFKGGLFYSTDVGPELTVSWENRNITGGRAKVAADSWISPEKKVLEGIYLRRDFLRTDQFLQLEGKIAEEDWDAYWTRNVGAAVSVSRDITAIVRASAGGGFRISAVEQQSDRNTYGLFFLPAMLRVDTTDSPLDPTEGVRLLVHTAPYWDAGDPSLFFWKTSTALSSYYDWTQNGRLVLASVLAGGAIAGAAQEAVPADVRFYVGGGGSVRGYGYQSLGPLDGDNPLGGRSFLYWNGELRWRFKENYGLAGFLDGGTAYDSPVPDFQRSFRWATGLGFRYYSPLGPFRIDVAFPLNRRAGIDDAFQIYVSLGQAF